MRRAPPLGSKSHYVAATPAAPPPPPAPNPHGGLVHSESSNASASVIAKRNAGSRTHRRTLARQINFKEVEDGDGKRAIKDHAAPAQSQLSPKTHRAPAPAPATNAAVKDSNVSAALSNGRPSTALLPQWKQQHSLLVDSSSDESEDDAQVEDRERRRAEADREKEKEMRLHGLLPAKVKRTPTLPAVASPALAPIDPPLVPDVSDYSSFHKKALKWQKPSKKTPTSTSSATDTKAKVTETNKPEAAKDDKVATKKLPKGKSVRLKGNTTDDEPKKKPTDKKSARSKPADRKLVVWKSAVQPGQLATAAVSDIKIEATSLSDAAIPRPLSPLTITPRRSSFISDKRERFTRKDEEDARKSSMSDSSSASSPALAAASSPPMRSGSLLSSSPNRTLSGASLIVAADMEQRKLRGSSASSTPLITSPRITPTIARLPSRPNSRKKVRRVEALIRLEDSETDQIFAIDDTTPRKQARKSHAVNPRSTVAPIVMETLDADGDELSTNAEIVLDLKTISMPTNATHAMPRSAQVLATFLEDLSQMDSEQARALPPPPLEVHQLLTPDDESNDSEGYEPSHEAVLRYADCLGMDLPFDADLLWIPRLALLNPLPPPWKACQSQHVVYFVNFDTGECSFTDPSDAYYYGLYRGEKERKWAEWIEGLLEQSDVRQSGHLDMSGQRLDAIGMEVLSDMIQGMGDMEDQSSQSIAAPGTQSQPAEIPGYNLGILLTHLNLSNNRIDTAGCDRLMQALSMSLHAPLMSLDLSGNHLSSDSCLALSRWLSHNPFIMELNLSNNENIGNMGIEHLARAFNDCPSLKWVSLAKTGINDFGCQYLTAGLFHHPALHTFDIAGNHITDAGLKSVGKLVVSCPTLTDLRIASSNSANLRSYPSSGNGHSAVSLPPVHKPASPPSALTHTQLIEEIQLCIEKNKEKMKARRKSQLALIAALHPRLGEKSPMRKVVEIQAWNETPSQSSTISQSLHPPTNSHTRTASGSHPTGSAERRSSVKPIKARRKPKQKKPVVSGAVAPASAAAVTEAGKAGAQPPGAIGRVGLARHNALMQNALRQLWSYL